MEPVDIIVGIVLVAVLGTILFFLDPLGVLEKAACERQHHTICDWVLVPRAPS